jgi:hypothetical protein
VEPQQGFTGAGEMPDAERMWASTRMVSFALPMIVPLLGFVAWVARANGPAHSESPALVIEGVFATLALLVVLVAPPAITRAARLAVARSAPERRPTMASSMLITRYAVGEIPLLLGFVLYFLGAPVWTFAAFAGLTVVSFAVNFPRREAFDELLAQPVPASVPRPL